MKNIAHILPWTGVGGTEHATLRIGRAVSKKYQSHYFCPADAPEVAEFFAASGEPTFSYPRQEPSFRFPLPYLAASWRLAGEFRRRRIELVHCADWTGVQYAAVAAALAGCKLISHVRNRNESIPRRDWRLLRLVDRFVFVSRDTERGFGYPGAAGRSTVLYDGIAIPEEKSTPAEVRTQLGLPPGGQLAAMAARVAEQKDFPTLIAAAALLRERHPGLRFVILGDYERHPEHRAHYEFVRGHLDRQGVADRFHFAGFRSDVNRLLGGMDLFVLSTHWEGLPLVILEAMAQGLPVVATAVDGVPEAVAEGETGYTVPHADPAALAAAIGRLLDDPDRAAAMGRAGRERVERQFSVAQFEANLLNLYDQLLAAVAR